jgi:NDP-sugar pyrophosphorylase family protein
MPHNPNSTTALILAGGLGTRLRSVIGELPKPLAPVHGRPFLEYQVLWLKEQGIRRIVLCVGYRLDLIEAHFGDGSAWDMQIAYSRETELLGTAGALRNAAPLLDMAPGADTFAVVNGDTYYVGAELAPLLAAHERNHAISTIGLVNVADATRYGTVSLDPTGYITRFNEKGQGGPGLINSGLYLFTREVFAAFPARAPLSMETDVFPRLVEQRRLRGHTLAGYHIDIGTPDGYAEFQRLMQDRH